MIRIKDDRELMDKHDRGDGFVYNDFGDATNWNPESFNKLHRASCPWVRPCDVEASYNACLAESSIFSLPEDLGSVRVTDESEGCVY